MGKRGVVRPKIQAEARRKGLERTIITQATVVQEDEIVNKEKQDSTSVIPEELLTPPPQKEGEGMLETTNFEPKQALEKENETQQKPWADVIKGNRSLNHGMMMEFVAPTIVNGEVEIEIEEADVADELEFWENSIILSALGETLSMNAVKKFMEMSWNCVALPELYYNEEGYFIMRFRSKEDNESVMAQGSYFIYGKPLFLGQWSTAFEMREDLLRVLPLWIIMPNLPLHLWGKEVSLRSQALSVDQSQRMNAQQRKFESCILGFWWNLTSHKNLVKWCTLRITKEKFWSRK
ncbi:unnamed protein product [Lathyrus sativus]|nr:unnamed protein product [Lathyrus sativus]